MSEPLPDKRVVVCNLAEAISEASAGALAFIRFENRGNGADHVQILLRSRGRRFIQKWESLWRLKNFRIKTLPPSHPCYERVPGHQDAEELLAYLTACHDRELRLKEGRRMRQMLSAARTPKSAEGS